MSLSGQKERRNEISITSSLYSFFYFKFDNNSWTFVNTWLYLSLLSTRIVSMVFPRRLICKFTHDDLFFFGEKVNCQIILINLGLFLSEFNYMSNVQIIF
jgi:hypothetical protein